MPIIGVQEDPCKQEPGVTGLCKAYIPRWTFNGKTCEKFVYGGCGGNENNFNSLQECLKTCAAVPVRYPRPSDCRKQNEAMHRSRKHLIHQLPSSAHACCISRRKLHAVFLHRLALPRVAKWHTNYFDAWAKCDVTCVVQVPDKCCTKEAPDCCGGICTVDGNGCGIYPHPDCCGGAVEQ